MKKNRQMIVSNADLMMSSSSHPRLMMPSADLMMSYEEWMMS